jgi:hypothetical protein
MDYFDGWQINVFINAGGWDYFDYIKAPNGVMLRYEWMHRNCVKLADDHPVDESAWKYAQCRPPLTPH